MPALRQSPSAGWVSLGLLIALLLAACSGPAGGGSGAPDPGRGGAVGASVRHDVDAGTRQEFPVGAADTAPLILDVEPGDFTAPGSITTTPTDLAGPADAAWFSPAGPVTGIDVTGNVAHPLTVRFAAGPTRADRAAAVPVIWHRDDQLGWSPIAAGDAGGVAEADRDRFSPYVWGWADVTKWLDGLTGKALDVLRGRTTRPDCGTIAAPKWASFTAPTLDILLACTTTNSRTGAERVEIQLKNNRGLVQQIQIPDGVDYADVEDQPDYVRTLVRKLTRGDNVLLPPGKRLSIGFTRPKADRTVAITPQASTLALAADLLMQLNGLAAEQGSDALPVALLELAACTGADQADILRGAPPRDVAALGRFVKAMGTCVATAGTQLVKAVNLAQQLVALQRGVDLALVQSDRAFGPAVEKLAGRVHLAAKLIKGAELFKLAVVYWENVGELLGRAVTGVNDPAAARLELTAVAAPATRTVRLEPVTAGGAAAPGWRVQPESLTVDCGYPSPAAVRGNVQYCAPTAAAADVCWPEPGGTSVLCLFTPWEKTLHRYPATNAATAVQTGPTAEPIGIELADGRQCRLRNGGSWSGRADDDSLAGFYSCDASGDTIIWARQGGSAFDTTAKAWTVRVGRSTDPLTTVTVTTAYVVATASR